ncbi:MAG: ABC transporter permease, partial [Chloroflexi bacterium]|nr:ABC transporter permease [Chloroflexota bacterium]
LVAPYVQRQYQIVYNGENVNTVIYGVTPEYAGVRNMKVARGRYISNNDVETLARVAVLGKIPAQNLFKGADPIGQVVKIQRVPFRVVGVLVEKGGTNAFGGSQDDVILVPLSTAQVRLIGSRAVTGSSRLVSAINISAVSEEKVDQLVQEITLELRRRHKIQFTGDDFTIITQKDLLGAFSQVTTILTIFLGAIAAISLLVGGIGIMNIMLVSVTERTREIGLRKAIGAKRWDILVQFLIEAVTLSILGGAIGILMGAGISAAVNSTGQITTQVSVESVALAVGFSLAVGLFFGIYPAVRASGLSPIEALRYE